METVERIAQVEPGEVTIEELQLRKSPIPRRRLQNDPIAAGGVLDLTLLIRAESKEEADAIRGKLRNAVANGDLQESLMAVGLDYTDSTDEIFPSPVPSGSPGIGSAFSTALVIGVAVAVVAVVVVLLGVGIWCFARRKRWERQKRVTKLENGLTLVSAPSSSHAFVQPCGGSKMRLLAGETEVSGKDEEAQLDRSSSFRAEETDLLLGPSIEEENEGKGMLSGIPGAVSKADGDKHSDKADGGVLGPERPVAMPQTLPHADSMTDQVKRGWDQGEDLQFASGEDHRGLTPLNCFHLMQGDVLLLDADGLPTGRGQLLPPARVDHGNSRTAIPHTIAEVSGGLRDQDDEFDEVLALDTPVVEAPAEQTTPSPLAPGASTGPRGASDPPTVLVGATSAPFPSTGAASSPRSFNPLTIQELPAAGGSADVLLLDSDNLPTVLLAKNAPRHQVVSVVADDGDEVLEISAGDSGKLTGEDKDEELILTLTPTDGDSSGDAPKSMQGAAEPEVSHLEAPEASAWRVPARGNVFDESDEAFDSGGDDDEDTKVLKDVLKKSAIGSK